MSDDKAEKKILGKVEKWKEPYRAIGLRLHEVIRTAAPQLQCKTMYGAPAYGTDKPVQICFRLDDDCFTLGLTEHAHTSVEPDAPHKLMGAAWFIRELDEATEQVVADIVRKAVSVEA